jgi:glycerol-3-phosphate dehydrogenase (NAD(P)+)
VSLAGAIKNIYAIACGMSHGLNLGQNARAALITRALAESKRLGCAMGAKADTFLGLAGVGDLLLSCCSDMSRNMTLGMELAKGKTLLQITDHNNNHNREHNLNHKPTPLTEGIFTVKALQPLLQHYQIRMPIASAVYDILYNDITIQQSMMDLLHTLSTPFEHE